jgi:glycosyltransferase involved in cell wall biosynthesis
MDLFNRVSQLISSKKLPWRIVNSLNKIINVYNYYSNFVTSLFKLRKEGEQIKIVFCCGFHGVSGGPIAISSIANMLAYKYQVKFVTYPTSNYNKLLNSKVKLIASVEYDADTFIADEGCDHKVLEKMNLAQGNLIITCHCLRDRLTGLDPDYIYRSFSFADEIHFVGEVQQNSFKLERAPRIIANSCFHVNKTVHGNSAGTVGRLTDPDKNAKLSFDIARKANLQPFHLWGADAKDFQQSSAVVHSWETDKQKIYNAIDVLVFMSKYETFGLVVIEAMSAGIPCLLSNIPAFQQYRDCPGIEFVDLNDPEGAENKLIYLMENKEDLRCEMMAHWQKHYSNESVAQQWFEFIDETLSST